MSKHAGRGTPTPNLQFWETDGSRECDNLGAKVLARHRFVEIQAAANLRQTPLARQRQERRGVGPEGGRQRGRLTFQVLRQRRRNQDDLAHVAFAHELPLRRPDIRQREDAGNQRSDFATLDIGHEIAEDLRIL